MGLRKFLDRRLGRRRALALVLGGLALCMVGLSFASVPLYRIFCQVTGFAGTTGRAAAGEELRLGSREVTLRFNADTADGLPWDFWPDVTQVQLVTGTRYRATYWAHNRGKRPIVGTATFNVTPLRAGFFLKKIECFCFTEQKLMPGEKMAFTVDLFIDPSIEEEIDEGLSSLTLSYTFFPAVTG